MPTPDPAPLIQLALQHEALRLGQFTLKSGRSSPYFFNMAQLHTGAALRAFAAAYADVLETADVDLLFGPAYKGIPLVAAVATELAGRGRDLPWAFNRKEAKTHGEGGSLVERRLLLRIVGGLLLPRQVGHLLLHVGEALTQLPHVVAPSHI